MTSPWDFWTSTCAVVCVTFLCNADHLPSPKNVSYQWHDPFTVKITWSWEKPRDLPDSCKIKYEVDNPESSSRTLETFWTNNQHMTEGKESAEWTYKIKAVGAGNCTSWTESKDVTITIRPERPAVKDFQCALYSPKEMNCSWIPVNTSLDLRLHYRLSSSNNKNQLKACEQPYSTGMRKGCILRHTFGVDRLYIYLNGTLNRSERSSTFQLIPIHNVKPPPPKLEITREATSLKLNWTHSTRWPSNEDCWSYKVCYKKCGEPEKECHKVRHQEMTINYVAHCRYDFQIAVIMEHHCGKGQSDLSEVVSYGADEPRDRSLILAVVAIPIILSVCIIVFCFCFRRHLSEIWPNIPNPSEPLKGIMSGKLLQVPGDVYVPVPEHVDPLTIISATENSTLAQNC